MMDQLQVSREANTLPDLTYVQFTTTSSFRDWTGLLPELLDSIVAKIGRLSDYIRFCGVCPQWRLVALESDIGHKQSLIVLKASRKKLPMLMFKTEEHNNETRGLYSVSDGMTYNLKLPQPCRSRCFGSSHGWLFCYDENKVVTLLNPLNNKCISLPVFEDSFYAYWSRCLQDYFLRKGILSADPLVNPNNYTVAVIYSGLCKLAYHKSGDLHWKFIDLQPERSYVFSDVLFYKNYLYGVTDSSELLQIDTTSRSEKTIVRRDESWESKINYLVESQGELLLVKRFWSIVEEDNNSDHENFDSSKYHSHSITNNFKIFKLVDEKESTKWVEVNNIGEQILFIGVNGSLSVSTVEFPECLSNSIYYTSQFYLYIPPYKCCGPDEDSGIFSLADRSSRSHHLLDCFGWYMEPPVWFVPNPDLANSV